MWSTPSSTDDLWKGEEEKEEEEEEEAAGRKLLLHLNAPSVQFLQRDALKLVWVSSHVRPALLQLCSSFPMWESIFPPDVTSAHRRRGWKTWASNRFSLLRLHFKQNSFLPSTSTSNVFPKPFLLLCFLFSFFYDTCRRTRKQSADKLVLLQKKKIFSNLKNKTKRYTYSKISLKLMEVWLHGWLIANFLMKIHILINIEF